MNIPNITNQKNRNIKTISYKITFEPLPCQHPQYVIDELTNTYPLIQSNPKLAIEKLSKLSELYPNIPEVLNNLATAFQSNGNNAMHRILIEKLIKEFPDYLFGRLTMARIFMQEGKYDKVGPLLNNTFELKLLYPERDVFHITEVRFFCLTMVEYYSHIKKIETAKIFFDILVELLGKDDSCVLYAQEILMKAQGKL